MTDSSTLVLAITPDDDLLHVGTGTSLLAHVLPEADPSTGDRIPEYEYHDATGAVLALTTDADGEQWFTPAQPGPAPGPAARRLLVSRIGVVLAKAQAQLDAEIADGLAPVGHTLVPRIDGDLGDVLLALAALAGPLSAPGDPNPGNWMHNLMHAAFG